MISTFDPNPDRVRKAAEHISDAISETVSAFMRDIKTEFGLNDDEVCTAIAIACSTNAAGAWIAQMDLPHSKTSELAEVMQEAGIRWLAGQGPSE